MCCGSAGLEGRPAALYCSMGPVARARFRRAGVAACARSCGPAGRHARGMQGSSLSPHALSKFHPCCPLPCFLPAPGGDPGGRLPGRLPRLCGPRHGQRERRRVFKGRRPLCALRRGLSGCWYRCWRCLSRCFSWGWLELLLEPLPPSPPPPPPPPRRAASPFSVPPALPPAGVRARAVGAQPLHRLHLPLPPLLHQGALRLLRLWPALRAVSAAAGCGAGWLATWLRGCSAPAAAHPLFCCITCLSHLLVSWFAGGVSTLGALSMRLPCT